MLLTNDRATFFVYLDGVSLSKSRGSLIKHRNNSSITKRYSFLVAQDLDLNICKIFFYKIRCFDGTPVNIIFIAEHLIFCFSFTQNMFLVSKYCFCLFTNFSKLRKPITIKLRREKKVKRHYNAFLKGVIT